VDYPKVIKAFVDGTIDQNVWIVIFDNDGGDWEHIGDDIDCLTEEQVDQMYDDMRMEYGTPDGRDGRKDVVDLARAAGIPAEWV